MPILTDIAKRVLVALACVCLAGALGAGWWVSSLRSENKSLSAANAALQSDLDEAERLRKIDQAVASRYAQSIAKLTTTQRATDAKLRNALAADASWSDGEVPAGVLDALRVPSTATKE